MDADADENSVPNSIVALRAQKLSVWHRNARRKYWPIKPGTIAQNCVEPSMARSGPITSDRTCQEMRDGDTRTTATQWARSFSASRTPHHLRVDAFDSAHATLERQLALDASS